MTAPHPLKVRRRLWRKRRVRYADGVDPRIKRRGRLMLADRKSKPIVEVRSQP